MFRTSECLIFADESWLFAVQNALFQSANVTIFIGNKRINTVKMAFKVIRKTTTIATDSLLTLANGEKVEVACTDFAPLQTVHSAASRLNARAGFKEFEITTPDNGAHIIIKRNRQ